MKYLIPTSILLGLAIGLMWYGTSRVAHNLQAEMEVNATLRRQVVELEERQKVYAEVFECKAIREGLGI